MTHATVLAIIVNGAPRLSLHQTQSEAWNELLSFINENWHPRMGSTVPPADVETRAEIFFRHKGNDLYAIIEADLTELDDALKQIDGPISS